MLYTNCIWRHENIQVQVDARETAQDYAGQSIRRQIESASPYPKLHPVTLRSIRSLQSPHLMRV